MHEPARLLDPRAADGGAPRLLRGARSWLMRLPVVLGALVALVSIMSFGGYYYPDTTVYLEHTFFTGLQVGFNDRPPVFPLLLDLLCYLAPPGARMFLLVLIQQACSVAVVYMIQRIGEVSGQRFAGWLGALLAVGSPLLWLYAHGAHSEPLYIFLTVLCCLMFLRGFVEQRAALVVLGGLVCALAIGCRTPGAAIAGAVLVATWWSREKRRIRVSLLFLSGLALGIGSLVGLNYVHFGCATLVNGAGIHMFNRIGFLDQSAPDTQEVRVLKELNAATGPHPETIFHQNAGWDLFFVLKNAGYTSKQADQLLKKAAIQSLMAHPLRSVGLSIQSMNTSVDMTCRILWCLFTGTMAPEEFEKMCETSMQKWGGDPEYFKRVQRDFPPYAPQLALGRWPVPLVRMWDDYRWLWRGTWVLVATTLVCVVGLVARSRPLILLAFAGLGQLFLSSLGEEPSSRYWDSCVPLFHMALVLAVLEFGRLVCGWWRNRRDPVAAGALV